MENPSKHNIKEKSIEKYNERVRKSSEIYNKYSKLLVVCCQIYN